MSKFDRQLRKVSDHIGKDLVRVADGFGLESDGKCIGDRQLLTIIVAMINDSDDLLKLIDETSPKHLIDAWTFIAEQGDVDTLTKVHSKIGYRLYFIMQLFDFTGKLQRDESAITFASLCETMSLKEARQRMPGLIRKTEKRLEELKASLEKLGS